MVLDPSEASPGVPFGRDGKTDTDALCYLDLAAVARLIERRKVSPVEVVDAVLERVQRLNPLLNAFITQTAETARETALQHEKEILAGCYRGPLHGVPVSLKDLYITRGIRTTVGSKILADWVPDRDATVWARLHEAGAVLVGKNNLHEFALGSTTINPYYGSTANPWDRERIAGGSSGGSAAATAAGLGYASMGSESGGSIRRPAAFCGVVGLKPTYGRVSRDGMLAGAWSLDHAGTLTRSVRDAALVLNAIAGHDPKDPTSSTTSWTDFTAGLEGPIAGLRVGVPNAYVFEDLDPEVQSAFWQAVVLLEQAGAVRKDVDLPSGKYTSVVSNTIAFAEVAAIHRYWFRNRPQDYGDDALSSIATGMCLTAEEYLAAQRVRRSIASEANALFQRVDAIVAPTGTPASIDSQRECCPERSPQRGRLPPPDYEPSG